MSTPPRYSVYVHGNYHYHGRKRARFVRWVLTNVAGLSVSLYDHEADGWLVLQNSVERASDANAEARPHVSVTLTESRSDADGY